MSPPSPMAQGPGSLPLDGGGEGVGVAVLRAPDVAREAPPEVVHERRASTPIPGPSPIEGEGRAGASAAWDLSDRVRSPAVTTRQSRRLREAMTLPEKRLWTELRRLSLHVRRQAPIARYVADFAIHSCKLIIELDGPPHALPEVAVRDAERDAWLATQGYRVLRFTNAQVMDDPGQVASLIQAAAA